MLKLARLAKINTPTINYILEGNTHEEVANNIGIIGRSRVTQIWNNWKDEIIELYENGTPKQTLIEEQDEKGINLTIEK